MISLIHFQISCGSPFSKHNKHCMFANYIYITVAFIILRKENLEVREHVLTSSIPGIQFCLDDSLDSDQFSVCVTKQEFQKS